MQGCASLCNHLYTEHSIEGCCWMLTRCHWSHDFLACDGCLLSPPRRKPFEMFTSRASCTELWRQTSVCSVIYFCLFLLGCHEKKKKITRPRLCCIQLVMQDCDKPIKTGALLVLIISPAPSLLCSSVFAIFQRNTFAMESRATPCWRSCQSTEKRCSSLPTAPLTLCECEQTACALLID